MFRQFVLAAVTVISLAAAAEGAPGTDWTAAKLRGVVEVSTDGQWVALQRDAVVENGQSVRTGSNGFVQFQRGPESISLSPGTVAQLLDQAGQKYTTVVASSGQVSVIAEARNVTHFEVDTPFLAAVVKGTQFTVVTGRKGSLVQVARGRVDVEDLKSHTHVLVQKGQTATTASAGKLTVTGEAQPTTGDEGLGTSASATTASSAPAKASADASGATATASANAHGGNGNASANASAGGGNANVNASANAGGANASANVNAGGGGASASANANVGNSGGNGVGVGVNASAGGGGVNVAANVNVGGIKLKVKLGL